MFFISSFLLILQFFFQTRKNKKNANPFTSNWLTGTACISSFSFWQNKRNVYWILIKQFTCISLYSIALSWLKHGRLMESYHAYLVIKTNMNLFKLVDKMHDNYFPTIYIVPLISVDGQVSTRLFIAPEKRHEKNLLCIDKSRKLMISRKDEFLGLICLYGESKSFRYLLQTKCCY